MNSTELKRIKKKEANAAWYRLNKERLRKDQAVRYRRNALRIRRKDLMKKFGVTLEWYEAKLAEQDGKCAICGKTPDENGRGLAVDHNHGNKKPRGLLCLSCNPMLGFAQDCIAVLETAISYLRRYA